jgi:hypothetical protein
MNHMLIPLGNYNIRFASIQLYSEILRQFTFILRIIYMLPLVFFECLLGYRPSISIQAVLSVKIKKEFESRIRYDTFVFD